MEKKIGVPLVERFVLVERDDLDADQGEPQERVVQHRVDRRGERVSWQALILFLHLMPSSRRLWMWLYRGLCRLLRGGTGSQHENEQANCYSCSGSCGEQAGSVSFHGEQC